NSRLGFNGANNPDPTYYRNLPSYELNLHNTLGEVPIWTPNIERAEQNRKDFLENPQINWERMYLQNRIAGRSVYALYADVMQDRLLTASTLFNRQICNVAVFNAGLTYRKLLLENFQEM